MKKSCLLSPRSLFAKAATLILSVCFLVLVPAFFENGGGRVALNAAAATTDVMKIEKYDVDVTISEDRQLTFKETIQMRALKNGSVFTRSLPLAKDRYSNIVATCQGDTGEFSYDVYAGEEDDYLHIDCVIPVQRNQTQTYEISYYMEIGTDDVEKGMRLDVIGYGWGVPLHDVCVNVHFPAAVDRNAYTVYSGGYGATGNHADVVSTLSQDGKTLTITAEKLELAYNDYYYESMAEGITLEVVFGEGVLKGFASTRAFTKEMAWIVAFGIAIVLAAVLIAWIFRGKHQPVPVVNIKAPEDMDPMKMGKLLDGMVDQEDVTSMIYFFAHKGYLSIDLEDEDDPVLIKKVEELPEELPPYQQTLFNGLFVSDERVKISALAGKFFSTVEIAKKQVLGVPMYEKKSILGFVLGGLLGLAFAVFAPLLISIFRIGNGYVFPFGVVFLFPMAIVLLFGYLSENYRYKWKKKTRLLVKALGAILPIGFSVIFCFVGANVIMTEYEKAALCCFSFAAAYLTQGALTRTEEYCETLGNILGFKEFIVFTEEDKIKFMLEEDPELYYKVLPYAQVLGVTDEWEEKFASLTIEPPAWCENSSFTVFDYMVLRHCIQRSMLTAMTPPKSQGGGSFAGRSGGGGFGGFGGGGHGGGGGGFR